MQSTGLLAGLYFLAQQLPSSGETEPAESSAGEPQSLPSAEVTSARITPCLAEMRPNSDGLDHFLAVCAES